MLPMTCAESNVRDCTRGPVRILWLGDSILLGYPTEDTTGGARGQVDTRLAADSITVEIVGSLVNGPGAHDCAAGETTAEILARTAVAVAAAQPEIVVLEAGTNDAIAGGISAATIAANLAAIMDAVLAHPRAHVVLCLPIRTFDPDRDELLADVAALLPAVVAARPRSLLVDTRSPWGLAYLIGDGIHPGAEMHAGMGDVIYDNGILVVLGR